MRDVADAAGVSPTTVSHALNGKGRVDPATVARVQAAATRLGYKPNATARNLRQGRTGLLGLTNSVDQDMPVALTDLDHFVRLVTDASATALAHGYPLVLAPPGDRSMLESALLDGMIILDPIANDPLVVAASELGVPVVTVGRDPADDPDAGFWVDNDLYAATVLALDHLAAQGAERISLMTPPPVHSWGVDMIGGYSAWTTQHGRRESIAIADGALTESAGYTAALELLDGPEPPDAIHCVIDRYALGTVLAARHLGRRVPEDMLVTAGTDSEATRTASPPLTSLELHPETAGRLAAELLIARLEQRPVEPHTIIPVDLVARRSTTRQVRAPRSPGTRARSTAKTAKTA